MNFLPAASPDGSAVFYVFVNALVNVVVSIPLVLTSISTGCGGSGTPAGTQMPPPPAGVCGNGVAESGESCDDGNAASGDGCSPSCTIEDARGLCAGVAPAAGTAIAATRIATGFTDPVHLTSPPLDTRRIFVVEQGGRILIIKDGVVLTTAFLDINTIVGCCGERGLLSLAFHPDYASNGRLFVNYTNNAGDTVIARYTVSTTNPDVADPTSAVELFTIDQPFGNHNGGQIAFGPDGYLYVGMGDGGAGGDPQDNAENDAVVLGKMLRVDVDVPGAPFFAAPADNPDPAAAGLLSLVWAKGLRNPFRFSFDRNTPRLYIGDVGQNQWEEINVVTTSQGNGANFGWDIFEGTHCFEPAPAAMCPNPPNGFTHPVSEYNHGNGCSVAGGFVYRGCAIPAISGRYFYGDFCSAFIRSFVESGGIATSDEDNTAALTPSLGSIDAISSFGEDGRGEIYILDHADGEIYKIVPG